MILVVCRFLFFIRSSFGGFAFISLPFNLPSYHQHNYAVPRIGGSQCSISGLGVASLIPWSMTRKLDEKTIDDKYPIFNISDVLDKLKVRIV